MPNSHTAETIALIKAHVGSVASISPVPVLPLNPMPSVTVSEILIKETESLTGRSGLARTIMQISVWSKIYEEAWATREAIKAYLLPFVGTAGTRTIGGVNHNVDTEFYDGTRSLHQHVTRLFVWWSS